MVRRASCVAILLGGFLSVATSLHAETEKDQTIIFNYFLPTLRGEQGASVVLDAAGQKRLLAGDHLLCHVHTKQESEQQLAIGAGISGGNQRVGKYRLDVGVSRMGDSPSPVVEATQILTDLNTMASGVSWQEKGESAFLYLRHQTMSPFPRLPKRVEIYDAPPQDDQALSPGDLYCYWWAAP